MKTDQELKQLAMDIYDNKVFTDRSLNRPEELGMVFMPLALGGFSNKDEDEVKEINMIYEYYDKAGPTSVNGFPTFFSLQYLTNKEFEVMIEYYEKYGKMKKEFESE